ncbi:MAG: flippase-like domain-containing protein [Chloroflexi bacterium]|nr:flippase-like domain-containing protein [Chloroflexota bacterium]
MKDLRNGHAQAVSLRKRVFSLPTLLSFGIAAAFIFFLSTRFDLDWSATWDNIRAMNPWLYVLGLLMYYASFVFRGMRWRILARNAGIDREPGARLPSVGQSSQLILIGWFVNSITWLRLGDAYRAYAFAEESRGKFSTSLGTVLAERVVDMIIIFALLLVSVIFLTTRRDSAASDYIVLAGFLMVLALVALLLAMRFGGARFARFLPGRFQGAYSRFQDGTLGSFKQLPLVFMLGAIGWSLEIARLYFVVEALGIDVGFWLVPVVALGHAILSTVPTPGGLGAVEPGITGLLTLSLARHNAVSIALVDRSITYVSVIVIGGIVFLLRQVAIARRSRRESLGVPQPTEQGSSAG